MSSPTAAESNPRCVAGKPSSVYIVDDDVSVRESLQALVSESGFLPEVFASAEQFLEHARRDLPGCLILDVNLPKLNGLELQRRIGSEQPGLPIVFITGHGDIPMTVRAMKAGAVEFLTKPFRPDALLAAVRTAVEHSGRILAQQLEVRALQDRYETLSIREREVMSLVTRGQSNKQVGATLGISEITAKAHRGRMMRKMKAKSAAALVTMAARLRGSLEREVLRR